jgi:hypothetical protein
MTMKYMGKILLSAILCIGMLFCMATAVFAVDDTPADGVDGAVNDPLLSEGDPVDGDSAESDPAEPTEPDTPAVKELDSCICGRPYYTADGNKHYKYDCIACGENLYMCKCDCWCGADSYSGISSIGTQQLYCSECKKSCAECICADKEIALLRESEIRSGTLSVLGLEKPDSVFPMLFLLIFMLVLCGVGIYSYRFTYGREIPELSEKKPSPDRNRTQSVAQRQATAPVHLPQIPSQWPLKGRTPAIGLYAAAVCNVSGRRASAPGVYPLTGGKKMFLSANDMAGLLKLSGLTNENATVKVGKDDGIYENLISLGFVNLDNDSAIITDKGRVYATVLFNPEEVISVGASSSALYSVCYLKGYGMALVKENGGYTVINDVKKSVLSEFIKDNLEPVVQVSSSTPHFSAALSYDEWTTLLAAYVEKDIFDADSLLTAQNVNCLNSVLTLTSNDSRYPRPEYTLDPDNVGEVIASLEKKGFVEQIEGGYGVTSKSKPLCYKDVKDTVYFDRRAADGTEISVLAVYRSSEEGDAVALICDTGSDVRVISSRNIPWDKYLG